MNFPLLKRSLTTIGYRCFYFRDVVMLSVILMVLTSGCARKPWSEPLAGPDISHIQTQLAKIRNKGLNCSPCFDADLKILMSSSLGKRAVAGYLQVNVAGTVRFVATNPMGQPLLAFTGDRNSFWFVDSTRRLFLEGHTATLFELYSIPAPLVSPHWGNWLTARIPSSAVTRELYADRDNRGVWVRVEPSGEATAGETSTTEHLLLEPGTARVISRIVTQGQTEKIVLQLDYDYSTGLSLERGCELPGVIDISGLDFGTTLHLELVAPAILEGCGQAPPIPVPPGYNYRKLSASTGREE